MIRFRIVSLSSFLLLLSISANAMLAGEASFLSPPTEEAQRLERFFRIDRARTILTQDPFALAIGDRFGFHSKAETAVLVESIPQFKDVENVINLYSNIVKIGEGSSAIVFAVTLKDNRSELGLTAGQRIALRVTPLGLDGLSYIPSSVRVLIRTGALRSPRPVIEYFPVFYGVYVAPKLYGVKGNPSFPALYEETELVDGALDQHKDVNKEPGYQFEECLGSLARSQIARLSRTEDDLNDGNFGFKRVDYPRIYHINRLVYVLPPGNSARRLDPGDFDPIFGPAPSTPVVISPECLELGRPFLREDWTTIENAKHFYW